MNTTPPPDPTPEDPEAMMCPSNPLLDPDAFPDRIDMPVYSHPSRSGKPDAQFRRELFVHPRRAGKTAALIRRAMEAGVPVEPPEGIIETLGFIDEPNPIRRGFPKVVPEIGTEAHKHFEEAMEKFARETLPPFRDQMRGLFQTIETTWVRMKPSLELLAKIERESNGNPIHPKDIRDERGVKHPSTVPPFWAARPNGRRR